MRIGSVILLWAIVTTIAVRAGADEKLTSPEAERSERLLAFLQSAIDDLAVTSETLPVEKLKFAEKPILRYNDPTRSVVDAGVWRLGTEGRPRALVTLEVYAGKNVLTYEFLSLSDEAFEMTSPRNVAWSPTGTDLRMRPLANGPKLAANENARLIQMRQLARRFTASEVNKGNPVVLRLMPQPVDRYSLTGTGLDGAAFTFANGTNPELLLLLESDGKAWSYGTARLSAAQIDVKLDDEPVDQFEKFNQYQPTLNYTSTKHAADVPQ